MWWSLITHLLALTGGDAKQIDFLPGTKGFDIKFKQHSGFLKASDNHFFFYWFFESYQNPKKDPVIVWFSGGPGCSSMEAAINEIGPFELNSDSSLRLNLYSWNKMASVVFIDSPVGVGFSYSSDPGKIEYSDTQTTIENYNAIKDFFRQHSNFEKNPLFLMGESYAGIHIPLLALYIQEHQADNRFNLKGIALGNPYLHEALNIQTSLIFAYEHALVDQHDWDDFLDQCCQGCIDKCDFTPGSLSKECLQAVNGIYTSLWNSGLNPFDIYRDCMANTENSRLQTEKYGLKPESYEFFGPTQLNIENNLMDALTQSPLLYGKSCVNDSVLITFMNKAEVLDALNVPKNNTWTLCNPKVVLNYKKEHTDMSQQFKTLMSRSFSILLYYGDTDMVCNFLMGQRFAFRLGLEMVGDEKVNWHLQGHAGFKTQYQTKFANLTFLTVRGAGHMAAQWRAPQVFHAVRQFIRNEPLK